MKVFIFGEYAKTLGISGSIHEGSITSSWFITDNLINGYNRAFAEDEYKLIPAELVNEPIEVIKLYFAL